MIVTIEKGCIICNGDLRGSPEAKYYCKRCNILFSRESLIKAGKFKVKRPIVEPAKKPVKKVEARLVGSSESDKFHSLDCRFAKMIKKENRVYFIDEKEAKSKGYKGCKKCY